MHLAQSSFRVLTSLAVASVLAFSCPGTARADRLPLLGSGAPAPSGIASSVILGEGLIVVIDPQSVPCSKIATFGDVSGGDTPGTSYDGLLWSGGLQFAEHFAGQTVSYSGDFDVVSGFPTSPLTLEVGAPGENLDVFAYTSNVLTGLGHLGYPDIDAIGEGSIAMYFPSAQARVSFQIVGGNGGSASLSFYRADGSLIDNVVVTGLADFGYGFATYDASPSIAGILIQSTDPAGIGVVNICRESDVVSTRSLTWGSLKTHYR